MINTLLVTLCLMQTPQCRIDQVYGDMERNRAVRPTQRELFQYCYPQPQPRVYYPQINIYMGPYHYWWRNY